MVSFWICDSIDLVCFKELSSELSIDWISTSVARDRVHDRTGAVVMWRPESELSITV